MTEEELKKLQKMLTTEVTALKEQTRILNEKIQKLEESTASDPSAGKPISDLPPVTELKDDSTFAIVQDSTTSKASVENVNSHIAKGFQTTRKKVLEFTETGASLTLDLSPHITYSKFHIVLPSARDTADIAISITGINDLLYGIESITMSGLDDGTDFLSYSKQGTITFTLDSTDYEFPSSVYHFGGFNNGNELIFLHIDYAEAGASSSYKYVIENAIYGDATVWNQDSTSDEDVNLKPTAGTTTLIFKHNGEVARAYTPDISPSNTDILYSIYIDVVDSTATSFQTDRMYFGMHSLFKEIGIIISTGILLTDKDINCTGIQSNISGYYYSGTDGNVTRYSTQNNLFKSPANLLFYMSKLRTILESTTYFDPLPTDFGIYSVVVRGTYAQKQLSV